MSDRLIEITRADWPELRDMYRLDWPANMTGYYAVDNFLRWSSQSPEPVKCLAIYSLNGEWSEDGTYLCIHRHQLFANTLQVSGDRLRRALCLVDWTRGYFISHLYERLWPTMKSILADYHQEIEFEVKTHMFYMSREDAVKLDVSCPDGITLKSLSVDDAKQVNDAWPNRQRGSETLVRLLIEHNPNIGAYDESGQLVAWCLRLQGGAHGAIQVCDTHLRRGLGLLVCKAFTRLLGELGHDSCAFVFLTNIASIKMFQKAGFSVIDYAYWVQNKATVEWGDDVVFLK